MDPIDPLDELLLDVLERPEDQWEVGVTELCAGHEAGGTEIRRRFELLRASGFLERAASPLAFPEHLGEFRLLERLGQGGMGVVFAARQERLGRTVALKLVRPEHLYFGGARERFQREIAAVARLSHPGIVSVFTVGDEAGMPYFAMELLRGASLDDVLRTLAGRQVESLTGADLAAAVAVRAGVEAASLHDELFTGPWTAVCTRIAGRIAEALAHAHQNGVLHRDVKPSNVIVTSSRVVLLDFGLARPLGTDRLTRDGSHVGSLPYMAPEQLRGEPGDARTDVYGLGVLLRELVTLRQPFLSPSSETTRHRILQGDGAPVNLDNHLVSWELATVCTKATEPEPRRRYAAAADFARDLENVLQRRPITARPAGALRRVWRWAQRRPALATGLLVGLFAAIGTPTAIAIGIAGQRDLARAAEIEQQQKAYEANLGAANAALQSHDAAEVRRRLEACPEPLRGFEWHHLALALDGSLRTLRGHEDRVTAVAMTADAALLASGGGDGEVRLWDVATGALVHRATHHHAGILQLAFTVDGRRLLAQDISGHTSVVDVGTRAVLAERQRTSTQDTVWIGVDASCVLASQGGWRILELDPQTLATRREIALEQIGEPPQALMLSDGRRLGAVSRQDLNIWDLATGRRTVTVPRVVTGHLQAINMTADGDRLALSDTEGRISIVDTANGNVVQVLSDRGRIGDVAFDRTGERLAAVGADGAVRAWEVGSGRLLAVQPGHDGRIHCVAFGGARMVIATAGDDRTVRLWSPFGSRDHQVLRGHVGAVRRLCLRSAGLVSGSEDGSLRAWEIETGMPLATRPDFPHHVNALAVTADGRTAFAAYHGSVGATDLLAMTSAPPWGTGRTWILDLAVTREGDLLLAATDRGCLLLDPNERRVVRELPQWGQVHACAIGGADPVGYAGGADGRVHRWVLRSAAEPVTLIAAGPAITALAIARDGTSLFVAAGTTLQRRDAADGRLVWERTSSSRPLALAVLADVRVVTGHGDGSVIFWDAKSGSQLLVRQLGGNAITALACDPGGGFVAAGGVDGRCHLLRATAAAATTDMLRVAGISAAMQLHDELRRELSTRSGVLASIDERTDLDPDLRAWMRTCERCWLPMPWYVMDGARSVVIEPGLPAERYAAARRVAEEYLAVVELRHPIAVATVVLASARLGEMERALEIGASVTMQHLTPDELHALEPMLRAGRALALRATGQAELAARELAALAVLAAAPGAPFHAVSLWREVESAFAK